MLIPMTVGVPPYQFFLWPALRAVIALGGSASIAELVLHGDGPSTDYTLRDVLEACAGSGCHGPRATHRTWSRSSDLTWLTIRNSK